jgi:iron complex transport system ATP-binding protein
MATPVVELRNISYVRNANRILEDVSWRIERGQHWALLGANGSGKTSLLKVVTGYEWPTEGEVFVLGERYGACDLREMRRRIGWVSSSLLTYLPTDDTALQVAASGLYASLGIYRDVTDEEWAVAREALARVNMSRFADRRYRLLSQGEQQRVLIARALVHRPALLILDEPCAGLDPAARENLLEDLARIAAHPEAPTLVMVTHHVEEIGPWITHAMILRAGRTLAQAPKTEALRDEHLSAAFGRPCRLERHGERYGLRVVG